MSNLEIRDCQLETEDAPVTVTSGGSLKLNSVNFTNNTNVVGSAALRIYENAQLNVEDCNFRHNSGNGSTIYVTDGSSLTVSHTKLANNRADRGGGALMINSQKERTTVIIEEGSEFRGNQALSGEGGAIVAFGSISLTIREDTIFKTNSAALQGGALFIRGHSTLRIVGAFFVENKSNFSGGGAIYAQNSMNENLDIQISNTIFSKNAATNQLGSGGAIRLHGSSITCSIERGVSFISNVAELDGAAIHVSDGPEVNISEAFFIGNEVREGGAAIYGVSSEYYGTNINSMKLRLRFSSFIQNRAIKGIRGGGAVGFTSLGTEVSIEKCRFHDNVCELGSGAAVFIFEGPILTIKGSHFVDNKAIWGGALFAQKQGTYDVSKCLFYRNTGERGGAISVRGVISLAISNSELINNSAEETGGAIRAENYIYWRVDRARFFFSNNNVTNNNAGYGMSQTTVNSPVTRGGGIYLTGGGEYVEILESKFINNSATEGGAIAAVGVRSLQLRGNSRFESNNAIFGGAAFVFIENERDDDIIGDFYTIMGAAFVDNIANSDGGAVRVHSSTSGNEFFPYNARQRTVAFRECVFRNNRALNLGGGLIVTGVGVELNNAAFIENVALSNEDLSNSGSGGGIAATDGASVILTNNNIQDNIAHLSGGGLFVMDSSVLISKSNFTQNSIREEHGNGNGGAAALMLTANRLLPDFERREPRRPILFECNDCNFVGNSATLYGGAIYYHNSDPSANHSAQRNCSEEAQTSEDSQSSQQTNLVECELNESIREQLRARVIRLARVYFESNKARIGTVLFTNHASIIDITDGELESVGDSFVEKAQSISTLEESEITIINNTNLTGGQGTNFASYPLSALLYSEDADKDKEGSSTLTFSEFRSGDRLRFEIEFRDAFGQNATAALNFTGELIYDSDRSGNAPLEPSGQTRGKVEAGGRMRFSGSKLEGQSGRNYTLKLQFVLREQELIMEEPLTINVTMRKCRFGEHTKRRNEVMECIECQAGTFSSNPSKPNCTSCEDVVGVQCFGRAAVPEDHYWHSSSLSLDMTRCIGQEACRYNGRFRTLNETETEAHLRGDKISYRSGDNTQCSKGYEGILCGSCKSGYGRETNRCRRCASKGVRYFLTILLILWSILFVGYFIRSVLQLSKRIRFNKKFLQSTILPSHLTGVHTRTTTIPQTGISSQQNHPQILPIASEDFNGESHRYLGSPQQSSRSTTARSVSQNSTMVSPNRITGQSVRNRTGSGSSGSQSRTTRQTHFVFRLQQVQSTSSQGTTTLLTLANPVAEVFKVHYHSPETFLISYGVKILINFLQITSLAVSINVQWTQTVRRTLLVLGESFSPMGFKFLLLLGTAGNLATGTGYVSWDCFLTSDSSIHKSLLRMTLLILFPASIFLFFALVWFIRMRIKQKTIKYLKQRTWLTFLSVNYFFYIVTTRSLLRFLACVKIKEDNGDVSSNSATQSTSSHRYWEEDTSVECFKGNHALLIGVFVVPLICAITIGFPVGTLCILLANAERLDDDEFVGTYGFLYRAYKKPYWEILILSRKGLIAAAAVFAYALGGNIQGLLCVLILVVSLALHLTFLPFKTEMHRLNYLETVSLSTTIAIFVFGLLFNDSKMNQEARLLITVLAIALVVCTLLLILIELMLSSEEVIDMLLVEHGIMDCADLQNKRLSLKFSKLVSYYLERIWNSVTGARRNVLSRRSPSRTQSVAVQMAN
eukprot:g3555.t1